MLSFKKGSYSKQDIVLLCDTIHNARKTLVCTNLCENCSQKIVCNDLLLLEEYLEKCEPNQTKTKAK